MNWLMLINMVAAMANNASAEAESTSKEVKNLQEITVSIGEVVGAIKEIAERDGPSFLKTGTVREDCWGGTQRRVVAAAAAG